MLMYYLSERTVSNAYSSILSTKTPNKFWGLLSIIHEIDSYPIKINHTYILSTKRISLWLDGILYFGNEKKDYGERDCFVRFPNEWIANIADPSNGIFKSDRINILDVACFIYKLTPFEKEYSASELIAKLMKEFNLSEEMVSSWFVYSQYEISYRENIISKSSMLAALKEVKSDLTDCISFEVPIKSRPGEMTRAPFIQTLYAGTNALKCLMFATFNLEELYPTSRTEKIEIKDMTLQQIYYGAPGTGKSHEINRLTEGEEVIRTTFHPDSDYSTFVGCYKPTMKVNTISKNGVETKEEQIVYRFVPQAFTKAYTAAWNTEDDVYLIIEEINRGNCAQIFGDLFQLLDRKDGVSEYPVDADSDLADYIRKELKDSQRDFPEGVKDGKKLVLPSNLYIWATMNTSDQSLFPIDSAFKRRWDWKYMKIKDEHKEWKVDIDIKSKDAEGNETSKKLDWWTFVDKINKIIASMTSSADKQLGYFFCKATKKTNDSDAEPTIITKDTFVSKVIFYLWNDVFKDYGFEDASLFRYKEVNPETNKEEEKDLTFPDFYDEAGEKVNTERLTDFVEKVLSWQQTKEEQK